jgi:diketogulonate reductase-like aldo/keto reductase
MIIIYKLGNFKTGKTAETESKDAMNTYIKLGYKLITAAWVSNAEYLKRKVGVIK